MHCPLWRASHSRRANVYHGVVEDRGTLGDGPAPAPADIARTARLAARVGAGALVSTVAPSVAVRVAVRRRR